MGGWVCIDSDNDFGIYIPYIYASVSFRYFLFFLTFRSNSSIVTLTKTVMMTRQHMLFSECLQLQFKALCVSSHIQF